MILSKFKEIDTLIFDVDGVLTNSEILVLEDGHLLRKMSTRDGYALKKAVKQGLRVAIITGGRSKGVVLRLEGLGIKDIFYRIDNKLETFEDYVFEYQLNPETILYMGDDLPDYEVMKRVGLPVCPIDAATEIKALSKYISPLKGGEGCVRDVIEKVLKLKGLW